MKRLILFFALVCLPGIARAQIVGGAGGFNGGNIGSNSSPVISSIGQPIPGVNIAICQPMLTSTAAVANNLATLTMTGNPLSSGYLVGKTLVVTGFTGADVYFNGSFTIASVSPTTISYSLVAANASATSVGSALQQGDSTTPCAALAPIFSDPGLTIPLTQPIFSDGVGNWNAYATPGVYSAQFYGPNIATTVKQYSIACVPGSAVGACGAISLGGTNVFTGSNTFPNINNLFFVGGTYPTRQAAINAAAAVTPTGFVIVPSTYTGTDLYTNTSCVGGIDLTGGGLKLISPRGGCGTFTQITTSPNADFPLGGDMNVTANGPADLFIRHGNQEATTTVATLTGGLTNNNVLVGSTTLLSPPASTGALLIGRGTSAEEVVLAANWTIVDATHINVTPANSHSGTTDIEQLGNTSIYTGGGLQFSTIQPASLSGHSLPARLKDALPAAGNTIMQWPAVYTDPFPYNAFQFSQALTGTLVNCSTGACPAKLQLRNSDSTHGTQILSSGNINICDFEDSLTVCSLAISFQNGNTVVGFSDAGLTQTYKLDGLTGLITANGGFLGPTYDTYTNCAGKGTAASPSVATCGAAAGGHFSCDTAATGATCQVNTTAVTANSEIFVFESDTAVTGTALGVTCNSSTAVSPTSRLLASSVAATSFTINLGTVTTNPACFSYFIVN